MLHYSVAVLIVLAFAPLVQAELETDGFDGDPAWDGSNNRIVPDRVAPVAQDFGYDATTASLGGRVTRAAKPAYYAAKIEPKTLNDKLAASGTFAISQSGSSSGVFFGWFNANLPEASGRPPSSIGLELDFEKGGGRLAVRAHSFNNLSAGKFVTKYEPYRTKKEHAQMRPTPIKNDGTRYAWTLDYDPNAAAGNGQVRFTIKSDSTTPGDFEGKPVSLDLPEGFREAGATFDRFGLINGTKPGGMVTLHFDDLRFDGTRQDFSTDPGWIESGSRATYDNAEQVGAHNFGFSAATSHAGGAAAGEVGGSLWHSGKYAYYADRIGPLSADERFEARGRVVLLVGAPDSDMRFGWFTSTATDDRGPFIGVNIGGPTRVGHYFRPPGAEKAPVLRPGKSYPFSIVYDPTAGDGRGSTTVTLGDDTVAHTFKPGQKPKDVKFDRFGLFNSTAGGQIVKIYFDDLAYTAG